MLFVRVGDMANPSEVIVEELKMGGLAPDDPDILDFAANLMLANGFKSVKQLASTDFDLHWKKRIKDDDETTKCTAGTAALIKQEVQR